MQQNKKLNSLTILSFLLLIIFSVNGQERVIHGKITLYDVIAVENAEISAKKTKKMVMSDSLGFFTIECNIKDRLSISAAGFKKKIVKIKNTKDSININLEIAGKEINIELAATQGHIKRDKVNFAMKKFNTKPIYSLGHTNTIALVIGKYPQINFVNNEFIIRGINTIGGGGKNGALIVINDMISSVESLKSMIVTEVINIEIITGYSASKYGLGAGNGVISVTLNSH